MTSDRTVTRRRYSQEFKAQVMGECDAPGASVAKVAMSHGINTNIVHGWRKLVREAGAVTVSEQFVPVAVAPTLDQSADKRSIEVELRRGGITVKLSWPMSAAMDLSGWMRELLR